MFVALWRSRAAVRFVTFASSLAVATGLGVSGANAGANEAGRLFDSSQPARESVLGSVTNAASESDTESLLLPVNEPLVPASVPDAMRSLCATRLYSGPSAERRTWHLSILNGGKSSRTSSPSPPAESLAIGEQPWPTEPEQKVDWLFHSGIVTHGKYRVAFGAEGGLPVRGDFNGDGLAELGIFVDGQWFLDMNGNGRWDDRDLWVHLGSAGDLPVTGDWDGDGKADIGVFGLAWANDDRALEAEPGLPDAANSPRPAARNPVSVARRDLTARTMRLTARGASQVDGLDHVFAFGSADDVPVVGDWNGDGIDQVGVFRRGRWVLDLNGDGRFDGADASFEFGVEHDVPVVADWNNDGITEVGTYRDGVWRLDNGDRVLDRRDTKLEFGTAGDLPVTGHFADDGRLHLGLFRSRPMIARVR
ncbi:MAG TPA: VCBS repeat-containing protein [Pirellulales bacterium]|nr:VCBS repeat-containing protein [Pirellulales bacterium]